MLIESPHTRIAALLPPTVITVECDPRSPEAPLAEALAALHPEERAIVGSAVAKRAREFAAGRRCARRALERLGAAGIPLLVRADRTPRWPDDVVGSITHSGHYCAVAAAPRRTVSAIGIDAETRPGVEPALWDGVLTDDEQGWLVSQPAGERPALARLLFAAKECTYKCQYALSGRFLGFHDVRIELDASRTRFVARLLTDRAAPLPRGARLPGRCLAADDLALAAMTLEPAVLAHLAG